MRLSRYAATTMAVATLTVITACGGTQAPAAGGSLSDPAMPGMTTSPVPPGAASGPAGMSATTGVPEATDTVSIRNFAFSPASVTIRVGTTLSWTNDDEDPHTVTAKSGPFRSGTLQKGDSYRYTFTAAGRYEYLCTIHPFMTATVVVTP